MSNESFDPSLTPRQPSSVTSGPRTSAGRGGYPGSLPSHSTRGVLDERENRNVLVLIAILTGITAIGTLVGLGYWGYSYWQAHRAISSLESAFDDNPVKIDLRGTWVGTISKHSDSQSDVRLTLTNSDKIRGTIEYLAVPCTESWQETSRDLGTIYVEEKNRGAATSKCGDAEWKVTIEGNTMTGELNWSSNSAQLSTITLHKQGS